MDDYPDLRQLIASRTPQQFGTADPFSPRPYNNYQPSNFVLGHDEVNINAHGFGTILSNNTSSSASSVGALYSPLDLMDQHGGWNVNGNDIVGSGNNSRWPRQETLTLLEIRSSLDSKFKETNQKGPLWDEVSRIMGDEHGYQRSGKKCKEKFENLYKYYKKTKEGKAGRQDGKHYRFFRQLEAIYGDHQSNVTDQSGTQNPTLVHTHTPPVQHGNSADFETSTSENEKIYDIEKIRSNSDARRGAKKRWKAKVEEFVSCQMRKVMKAQEGWMENVLKSIEGREEELLAREEELRNREQAERFNRQVHEFWAKERAWVETRDASIMEAVNQIRGSAGGIRGNKNKEEDMGLLLPSSSNRMNVNTNSFYIPINQGENLWNRYGVKIDQQGISMTRQK